jgi:DNA polymerase
MTVQDDREELAELVAALRAHVTRREASGAGLGRIQAALRTGDERRLPASRSSGHRSASSSMARGARAEPAAAHGPVHKTGPGTGQSTAQSMARSEAERVAAQVREKAQACRTLEELASAVAACTACELCKSRTQTVFSDGTGRARVLFVGEAPGEHEDRQGVPFVGRAGQLLTDIIVKGMGLARQDVAIANVLKCRPPGNRDPSEVEKIKCTPFLDRQIELFDPAVIIPLGRHAANHILRRDDSMGTLRGRVHKERGRVVVPTYHPAFLLRNPAAKKECWEDIQLAMTELGLQPKNPPKKRLPE